MATWTMQFKRIKNGICWDFILSHENNFVFVVDVKGFATQTICAVHISSQSYVPEHTYYYITLTCQTLVQWSSRGNQPGLFYCIFSRPLFIHFG